MSLKRILLTACIAVLPAVLYGEDSSMDGELEKAEMRLQQQRADAVRSRLVLYADELIGLYKQLSAAGDEKGASAVKAEQEAVQAAIRRLTNISKGINEAAAEDEKSKDEDEPSEVMLATRRVNGIINRFTKAKNQSPPETSATVAAGQGRQKILKIEKASMKRSESGGRNDWTYKGIHASWTVNDMVPGDYEVILRYSAGEKGGGKALLRVAGKKFDVTVPKGEKGSRKQELTPGTVRVAEAGMDVRIDVVELADGADYLWDLQAVVLQPVTAPKRP